MSQFARTTSLLSLVIAAATGWPGELARAATPEPLPAASSPSRRDEVAALNRTVPPVMLRFPTPLRPMEEAAVAVKSAPMFNVPEVPVP